MDFLIYLLKSSALLLLFFLFYYTFLKQDTYHQFKRKYLISALFISILLPLLKFSRTVTLTSSNAITTSANINKTALSNTINQQVTQMLTWQEVLLYIYLIVSSILLIRLIYKYAKLYLSISKKDYKVIDQCKVHIVDQKISPFSFFKHIIISKKDFVSDESNMILTHEVQHIKNAHYIDILLMNLFCVAFWFHPIIWLHKKLAIQNLEHQADDYCIQQIDEKIKYQYLLVNSSLQNTDFQPIASNIFQPSIKQRIMMINKKNTRNIYALKSLILLPVLTLLIMSFQTKVDYKKLPASQDTKQTQSTDNFQPEEDQKIINRIIVKFTEDADQEYLDFIKDHFKSKYDIDITYSNIQFKNDQLAGLKIAVDCNDDFSGAAGSDYFSITGGIYFYRDYSKNAASPFGIGSLPLPKFQETEKKDDKNDIKIDSQILFSSAKAENVNLQKVSFNEDEVTAIVEAYKEKLLNVNNYIINNESYAVDDLSQKTIVLKEFEFLDEKNLKIKGDIVDLEDYKKYFKSKLDQSQDNRIQDLQLIIFLQNQDPFFANLDEFKFSVEKN